MKKLLLMLFLCAACLLGNAQKNAGDTIKQYYFVLLLSGANRNQDSATAAHIQEGHMANMTRLYKAGKLKVAGPFGDDNSNWRGLFIFDCAREELESLLKTDPAIAAGRLTYEIHTWYTMANGSFKPGKPNG